METSIWERFLSYQSTQTIQKRLEKHYASNDFKNASGLSYDNSYRLIYFLKHGENFFTQANQAPHAIQPILLFYGFSQLLKACLIIKDPDYPSTSSVLAHGVSSRKRKKQQYQFIKDEVKIQRHGLFPHVAEKLFQIKHLDTEKYTMEMLLRQIAEMNEVFLFHQSKNVLKQVKIKNNNILIDEETALAFHMSQERLTEYLCEKYPGKLLKEDNHSLSSISIKKGFQYNCLPFSFNLEKDTFHIPSSRDFLITIPELLVHYLLLYNLSMISRYETEWWYELLLGATSDDYPFILRYMEIAKRKVPYFIFNFLEMNL
ncbi:YaaC family protein [Metabacillus litoralis]|uniref:YaaC family protein n=1 Tax=Metabacillus litoralis TaxID=152268 RepID=UPI001CFCE1FB|nr:YaaC family protein [Metabacillus litoralis]